MLVTNFPEVKVMYVESENGIQGSSLAFDKLEAKLPTLKKRKFHGVIWGSIPKEKYWAGVEISDKKEAALYGFEIGVIPEGKYVQEKVKDWSKNLDQIGKIFSKLSKEFSVDDTRPSIEFYRSMDEVLLRLPIK